MEKLTKSNFQTKVESGNSYSVVVWVIPTHKACIEAYDNLIEMEKKFTTFAKSETDTPLPMKYYFVNIDESPELAMSQSIRKVPYTIVYDPHGMPTDILPSSMKV